MRPQCKITIDGKLASGVFMERLVSCEVTDKDGATSDSVSIELNDFPPAAIPRKGAIIRVWMGYSASTLVFLGAFTVDEVEVSMLPYTMSISGKGADLREKMKENKSRHWDESTINDIVSEIAGEHGLGAKVDSDIGATVYSWLGQEGESDIHLLERLARRQNALFSVKDGKLVFAARGTGANSSGTSLPGVTITRDRLVEGSAKVRFADRSEFKKVKASWQDRATAERKTTEVSSSDTGTAEFVIGEPLTNEVEAKKAAGSKAKELKRDGITASCSVVGDPGVRAGAGMTFSGCRSGVDGIPFIIESAAHSFSKSGYVTAIDAKLKV